MTVKSHRVFLHGIKLIHKLEMDNNAAYLWESGNSHNTNVQLPGFLELNLPSFSTHESYSDRNFSIKYETS